PEEQEVDENFEGWDKKSFSNREEFEQKHNFQPQDQEQELENLIFSANEVEDKTVEEPEVSLEEFISRDKSSFTSSVTSTLISSSTGSISSTKPLPKPVPSATTSFTTSMLTGVTASSMTSTNDPKRTALERTAKHKNLVKCIGINTGSEAFV